MSFILLSGVSIGYCQTSEVRILDKGDSKSIVIAIEWENGKEEQYGAGCGFRDVTTLSDSIKLLLLQSLFDILQDTTYYYGKVKPLSYRYNGRDNKQPQSTVYNMQIAALVLINYVALSSDAVSYSPFPVIYDKKKKKEITTAGKELDAVIKCYKKWFKQIKKNGFGQYNLPMISKQYEWYGSLYQKQRLFDAPPKWEKLYSCPVLIKQED